MELKILKINPEVMEYYIKENEKLGSDIAILRITDYCPFCGGDIETWHGDGSQSCFDCGERCFVIKHCDEED